MKPAEADPAARCLESSTCGPARGAIVARCKLSQQCPVIWTLVSLRCADESHSHPALPHHGEGVILLHGKALTTPPAGRRGKGDKENPPLAAGTGGAAPRSCSAGTVRRSRVAARGRRGPAGKDRSLSPACGPRSGRGAARRCRARRTSPASSPRNGPGRPRPAPRSSLASGGPACRRTRGGPGRGTRR